jgi:hypothetical protein
MAVVIEIGNMPDSSKPRAAKVATAETWSGMPA